MKEQEFFEVLDILTHVKFNEYNCIDYEFDEQSFSNIIMNIVELYAFVTFKNDLPINECIDLTFYVNDSYDFNDVSKINLTKFVSDVHSVIKYLDSTNNYYDEDGWRGRMCWEWEPND